MSPQDPLEFSGEEWFPVPPEQVYEFLTNLEHLQQQIPDLVSAERVDDRTLNCVVRPGFSFLRGTMKMQIQLVDLQPPSTAHMQIQASGIGQSIRIASESHLAPARGGTQLSWTARVVERRGLIATIGKSLIQAAAGQVLRDGWQRLHQHLGS